MKIGAPAAIVFQKELGKINLLLFEIGQFATHEFAQPIDLIDLFQIEATPPVGTGVAGVLLHEGFELCRLLLP